MRNILLVLFVLIGCSVHSQNEKQFDEYETNMLSGNEYEGDLDLEDDDDGDSSTASNCTARSYRRCA